MSETYLVVGKLRRPHGVRGEMQMDVLTDFPERLRRGATLLVGEEHLALSILRTRWHNEVLLVQFEGYHTPEEAGALRNMMVYVRADDRPALPEGEYYHHQLLGLKVVDEAGTAQGEVEQVLETGANDVLVVRRPDGRELLVPYHDEFVVAVDIGGGKLTVKILPGLLDEE